jgi:O-antigen ligase
LSKLTGKVWPPQIWGAIILGFMAFSGVFARGLVNGAYALLALWGVFYLFTAKKSWWIPPQPLPKNYLRGVGLYFAAIVLTVLVGSEYGRGFRHLLNVAYLLAAVPLTWLALTQRPAVLRLLPALYAAGLLVAAAMTFKEANFGLNCVRAKASLGIIELGAVLSQVTPLAVGALALAVKNRDRKMTVLFLAALIASFVAHTASCSRIALLSTPVLSVLMLWAHRDCFAPAMKVAIARVLVFGLAVTLSNERVVSRFKEMGSSKESNYNNAVRLSHWRQGIKVFLESPIVGVGPRAVPNSPPVPHPTDLLSSSLERPKYYHAHQVFITVLAESGLVGLAGFLALHLAPILVLWPWRKHKDLVRRYWVWGAFVVALQLFFNGLTDNVFTLKPLMYIYWTVTGAALWAVAQKPPQGP